MSSIGDIVAHRVPNGEGKAVSTRTPPLCSYDWEYWLTPCWHFLVCMVGKDGPALDCAYPLPYSLEPSWGNMLVFFSAVLYTVDVYGAIHGASAVAANGLLRYILGATFPLFSVQMYQNLGFEWASSLLGFVTVALPPTPHGSCSSGGQ